MFNSTTDIDGYWYRYATGMCGFIEHRTKRFMGNDDDNISVRMTKRLCSRTNLDFSFVGDWHGFPDFCIAVPKDYRASQGRIRDSRHVLWIEYTADRAIAAYVTMGNISPLGDRLDWFIKYDLEPLKSYFEKNGMQFRILQLNEKAMPNYKDQEWLRSLTYWT